MPQNNWPSGAPIDPTPQGIGCAGIPEPTCDWPRPQRPFFSSGPCVKPKEWHWDLLEPSLLGRSHRSIEGVDIIAKITASLRLLLNIPDTHWVGLTPGSATGAIEMALWNLLRPETPVDVLEWDVFSRLWSHNITRELKLPVNRVQGPVPRVFQDLNPNHDCVLTWCGTTNGVWVGSHQDDFLNRRDPGNGLVIADAASAVLTTDIPWTQLDATTFSWQKGLGAEAALGVIVLGPRAIERLNAYTPQWAIPRLMQLKDSHGILPGIFRGEMINTVSMMIMQEYAAVLQIWHQRGGLSDALARTEANYQAVARWCQASPMLEFSVPYLPCRAKGPVLVSICNPRFQSWTTEQQWSFLNALGAFLSKNQAGFDLINHARSFPSLRLWCGPATETTDLEALFPWIDDGLSWLFQRF